MQSPPPPDFHVCETKSSQGLILEEPNLKKILLLNLKKKNIWNWFPKNEIVASPRPF